MLQIKKYKVSTKQLKKNISILLIVVIAISSSNWLINLHFCGGNIVSFGLFVSANSCGMETDLNSCENGESDNLHKKSCCSDHSVSVSSNDLLQIKSSNNKKLPTLDLSMASTLVINSFSCQFQQFTHTLSKPPWTLLKILSEYQVFRI